MHHPPPHAYTHTHPTHPPSPTQHNLPQMHSQVEAQQPGIGAGAYGAQQPGMNTYQAQPGMNAYQAQPGMNAYQAQHPGGMAAGEYQVAGNKDRPDAPDLFENKNLNPPLRQVVEREP